MEKIIKEKIESLEDVFIAWMGGYPDDDNEIRQFLSETKLDGLFDFNDIKIILDHDGFLSDKALQATYSLLPATLKVKDGEYALFQQTFNRLNTLAGKKYFSKVINTSLPRCAKIIHQFYDDKKKFMDENRTRLKANNDKLRNPEQRKKKAQEYYRRKKDQLSEEKKAQLREKARLRMRKYQQEHPECIAEQKAKALARMTEGEKILKKIAIRHRAKVYQETHKEEISKRRRAYRENMSEEQKAKLKEQQQAYVRSDKGKKNSHEYYMRNKEEINRKARENPKTAEYKRKYKRKLRLKKTGPQILNLLQGIIDSKTR